MSLLILHSLLAIWNEHSDVRRMQQRQLSVSAVQAISRIRLRRAVDEDGRCPQANVYMVLPKDADGDAILANIKADMPGLNVREWPFEMDGPKVRRPRKGSSHEALISFMETRLPGKTPLSLIGRELSLGAHGLRALKEILRDSEKPLAKALSSLRVQYSVVGRGRGARSFLVKHQSA